eukprot:792113-Pyramimonas_sp.AAC.1
MQLKCPRYMYLSLAQRARKDIFMLALLIGAAPYNGANSCPERANYVPVGVVGVFEDGEAHKTLVGKRSLGQNATTPM